MTVDRVVLCNAVTGETVDYKVKDVPQWVEDRVYSADLLVQLYDYYGTLKHGYFNSVLGQKDCLASQRTDIIIWRSTMMYGFIQELLRSQAISRMSGLFLMNQYDGN